MSTQIRVVVAWKGDQIPALVEGGVLDGIESWMYEPVRSTAVENCPKKWGTLRSTHAVRRAERKVLLGAGGPSAPYAERQHNDASLKHAIGTDHWMSKAFEQHAGELTGRISEKVQAKLKV
jgi:hypothetical protein